ncbi:VanZ family protein [Microbacterium sp. zg.B48]|uniref:VanZ family protein n=1 Tax=Microbacterium sp. zg.B48 TaxID=2969408 RepID=UPI00214BB2D1|nr:VanZ family protein [Microbacterium sp. zg.B48]MCR2763269.1 VanZ family protein [Microbacterium sp. zg.B48]
MTTAESSPRKLPATRRARARLVLAVYAVTLALIALWPVPVDGGAGPLLRTITRVLPALTYARIEFSANILLFVPLGVLLMLILRRRYLILPIAIVVTVAIECAQGLLLDKRTPSTLDIIANTAGACIGMLIVAFVEYRRALPPRRPAARMPQTDSATDAWATLGFVPPHVPPLPLVPPRPPRPSGSAALAASQRGQGDGIPSVGTAAASAAGASESRAGVGATAAASESARGVGTIAAASESAGGVGPSAAASESAGVVGIPSVGIPPKPPLPSDVPR